MASMSNDQFSKQISKTGFVLENKIAEQLKAAKWTVISNRYYVDDTEESVREIDLVAYQATKVQHFDVYTTLLISCKKSESNVWALLARDIDLKNPNSDWQPLHTWSNDKALMFQLDGAAKRYHQDIQKLGVGEALQNPAVEVFAFQEMNKTSGAPQNDKSIFSAITSLMKAQAYELGALAQRKKTPAIYQFNLLSVVDTDLIRLMFTGDDITASPVDSEHYIARYIIKKRETFSRIRFLQPESFSNVLKDYAALHSANCQWFNSECDAFYADIVKDAKRRNILLEDFQKQASWSMRWPLIRAQLEAPKQDLISLYWDEKNEVLKVGAPFGEAGLAALNADIRARERVSEFLKSIYRYSGRFEFDDDILF